jgi:tRNA (cmo5U34)-methyltransferase
MSDTSVNLWSKDVHAAQYLSRADSIPHRTEGEAALLEWLPARPARVLDLGSGDGRLLSIVMHACTPAEAVALDFSAAMLDRLRARFSTDPRITVVAHDLDRPLPPTLGTFDAIVSSFAIHHLSDSRKRDLYREIYAGLRPGGVFCNLEHVASPTLTLHHQFLARLNERPEDEDPSNKLLDVRTQLTWLRDIGFIDVDCQWKWRELALLVGCASRERGQSHDDRSASPLS